MIYLDHKRNTDPEWMDDPNLDEQILQNAINDINKINKWLGGFKFTLSALQKELKKIKKSTITIVDAGCGDGEMLRYLSSHINDSRVKFLGLDFSANSIEQARQNSIEFSDIRFRKSDILQINAADIDCDILISTLTMHHFNDTEIISFLKKFKEITTYSIIINDLHRSRLAFMLFQLVCLIFIRNEISKHDGLISIASGFKRADFKRYAQMIPFNNDSIQWKWSFRFIWLIPVYECKN
ncbi:SAM-dependent methyltransferase [Nonlabens arenilitoris]|uniref:SAM-dependent methyltransferase n=1 Tax=Nonlabens arenilitoris TaxID=1217969 RepID=A0A2S7UD16_9FLAO|nr:methyltransferase domain-containing protein [Nonlabens arenilitoris]PQJ32846.1 SAM-dependent methyltransferase [Nonlabens arenilitoris]